MQDQSQDNLFNNDSLNEINISAPISQQLANAVASTINSLSNQNIPEDKKEAMAARIIRSRIDQGETDLYDLTNATDRLYVEYGGF